MKVKEIMSKNPVTIQEGATLKEANSLLIKHKISGLPVVNQKDQVVGIITEGDLIRAILPSYAELYEDERFLIDPDHIRSKLPKTKKMLVKEIMTPKVFSVEEETPIMKAASLMLLRQIKRLPVINQGKLVGIVSRADICNLLFK